MSFMGTSTNHARLQCPNIGDVEQPTDHDVRRTKNSFAVCQWGPVQFIECAWQLVPFWRSFGDSVGGSSGA